MIETVQVLTAVGSEQEAEVIAAELVEARLAACVQIVGPIQSRYRWQGRIERTEEWLCLAKTTAERGPDVVAEIARIHSYETPEIVVTPIIGGAAPYLDWIASEVAAGQDLSGH